MDSVKLLDWDSNFFNLKIAEVISSNISECEKFLSDINWHIYDLIYIIIPNDTSEIKSHSLGGPIDIKYTFSLNLDHNRSYYIDKNIKIISKPSEKLLDLAFQSGHESRFKLDKNFKEGEFERFYTIWIVNSFNGIMANYVLGYYEDHKLLGFISLKFKEDKGEIGLFAVDSNIRNKGIGTKLMQGAIAISHLYNKSTLNVATQKENKTACNFYKKMGFTLKKVETIYHKWNKNKNNDTI